MKAFAVVIGIALLGIGLFIGGSSLEAYDGGETFDCGSAFSPAIEGAAEQKDQLNELTGKPTEFGSICRDKRDSRKPMAFASLGLGAAILVGSFFLTGTRRE